MHNQFGRQRPTVSWGKQTLNILRPPGACGVIGEIAGRSSSPDLYHRHQEPPSSLHLIDTHKQGGVIHHYVPEQCFISVRRPDGEGVLVIELHLHGAQVHLWSGVFSLKAKHNAFIGLDRHHQSGRLPIEIGLNRKRLMRHSAKLDRNFRGLLRKPLPGAEVERHALPAPVVEEQPERDKRLSLGIRRHTVFFAVARSGEASTCTSPLPGKLAVM